MSRRSWVAGALALTAALATSCGSLQLQQLPAPKGVHGPTYRVTAQFYDVQNLTLGAPVKLQGVVIGDVATISTHDFHADVGMDIQSKFPLAGNSTFQVRFTTPLGEDFVAAATASGPGQSLLRNGSTVPQAQTGDAPGIEDTFAALSLLLNGGGLEKVHTIVSELDAALHGRAGDVRDALTQLNTVISNFDAHKDDFDKALDGLSAMAVSLNRGNSLITQALDRLPQAIQLLADDTAGIRAVLARVATLGDTVRGLLSRGQANMLATFDNLRPTLDSLRATEANLVPTFDSLIKFGQLIDRAAPGDYLNISVTVQFLLNATPEHPKAGGSVLAPAATTASDAIDTLLTGGLK